MSPPPSRASLGALLLFAFVAGRARSVAVTVGGAVFPLDGEEPEVLIDAACGAARLARATSEPILVGETQARSQSADLANSRQCLNAPTERSRLTTGADQRVLRCGPRIAPAGSPA